MRSSGNSRVGNARKSALNQLEEKKLASVIAMMRLLESKKLITKKHKDELINEVITSAHKKETSLVVTAVDIVSEEEDFNSEKLAEVLNTLKKPRPWWKVWS